MSLVIGTHHQIGDKCVPRASWEAVLRYRNMTPDIHPRTNVICMFRISEKQTHEKLKIFEGYSIDPSCMELADSEAIFLHCLPAHRGEEVSIDMLDHDKSKVWSQAENRLHVQQALLEYLLIN